MTFWNFITGNTLLYSGCCFLRACKKNFTGFVWYGIEYDIGVQLGKICAVSFEEKLGQAMYESLPGIQT